MEPIQVDLELKAGFSIGSGFGLAGILDDTIMRDAQGMPYIPGTSLKGIVRLACEELALIKGLPVHGNVVDELKGLAKLWNEEDISAHFSPTARIFGTPFMPGLFQFESAYLRPATDRADTARLIGKTAVWSESHNSIDRYTGTAKEDHLFSYEVAVGDLKSPAYHFRFSVSPLPDVDRLENGDCERLVGFLLSGIRFADRIGAGKSRGKGVIEMKLPPTYAGKAIREWLELTLEEGRQ